MNSAHRSIDYRGAPFIISAADVPTVLNLLKTDPDFTGTDSRTGHTWFQDVYIHQAKTNILQAPVRAILLQTPPKIALMDIGGAAIGVLQGYLKDSGLFTSTSTAAYPTIGDVFTQFDNVSDFTTSNGLTAGGFAILWAPHWNGSINITTSDRDLITQKISAFVDPAIRSSPSAPPSPRWRAPTPTSAATTSPAIPTRHFMTTATGTNAGLHTDQLHQPSFPSTAASTSWSIPTPTVQA